MSSADALAGPVDMAGGWDGAAERLGCTTSVCVAGLPNSTSPALPARASSRKARRRLTGFMYRSAGTGADAG